MKNALWIALSLALAAPLPAVAQNAASQAPVTDPVIRAMIDELERSMTQLKLNNLDSPYFIQYVVLEEEEYAAMATFGALRQSSPSRQRLVNAQVRVGNYNFDNSEFAAGRGGPARPRLSQATLEDDYASFRHTLWLATDMAYKQAVETLAQKRSATQNRTQQDEPVPDFSREPPTIAIAEKWKLQFDKEKIDRQLREWSQIFREFPALQTSNISFRARLNHRYIVNSEGTRTMQPELVIILQATAGTQADDGQTLSHSLPFYARSFEDLPATEAFAEDLRKMARELTALREAPTLSQDYSGPALLVGQASAEMFARVLAPNLAGHRGPLTGQGQSANPPLEDRLKRPILPAYISAVDDPGLKMHGNNKLIGYYQIDDQGVPAQKLSLVEGGLLTNLLMSRRPGKGRSNSNGHGRNGYPGLESPQIGNLIITATDGKNYEELKAELLETAKEERLDYGIVIKGVNPLGGGLVGTPILTYKVYIADGREELVRVGGAGGLAVSGLRHLLAVGNDSTVSNRLVGTQGAETPTSVVAPSALVEEISLSRPSGAQQKPSLMTHPFFATN
jgi:predicted Zn-dependent protease